MGGPNAKQHKAGPALKLFGMLAPRERRRLLVIAPALALSGALEVASLAAISPFVSLLTHAGSVEKHGITKKLYEWGSFSSDKSFFLALGLGVLALLVLSNAVQAITTYALLRFSWNRNHTISERLLAGYLNRPYEFFVNASPTELSKNVLSEVGAVVSGALVQWLSLISRLVVVIAILVALILLDPGTALTAVGIFAAMYGGLYATIRRRLRRQSAARSESQALRFKIAAEVLGGVKEAKLLGVQPAMLKKFRQPSLRYSHAMAGNAALGQLPRFAFEVVGFGGVLAIVGVLFAQGETLAGAVPILGVYLFAAYRLLPNLQIIFSAVTSIRFSADAVETVALDLDSAVVVPPCASLPFSHQVELANVTYRYPGTPKPVLSRVNLSLRHGEWVAIVGPTGAGKTTLVDILLGLLVPTEGTVSVDGSVLGEETGRWRASVAYVPQTIFLSDDTIAANIAFGVERDAIDLDRVRRSARIAQLADFVETTLPSGYESQVGERGIRLSGGQRQRIGIARALYSDRPLLVLDEATSALDSKTEEAFFKAIRETHSERTIVSIAHRQSTTVSFDRVVLLIEGEIREVGTPADLMAGKGQFAAVHPARRAG